MIFKFLPLTLIEIVLILYITISFSYSETLLTLPKFDEKPTIDGTLNEQVWNTTAMVDSFVEFSPKEGRTPPVKTTAYFGYDNENLYIGFKCEEYDINSLRSTEGKRDGISDATNDYMLLFLWTSDNPQAEYTFIVNSKNLQSDGYQKNWKIDFEWQSAVKIFPDRWEGEIALPLRILRFPKKEIQKWKFLVVRDRPRSDISLYSFPPLSQNNPSFFNQAGTLVINEPLSSKFKRYDLTPYIIASQTGTMVESRGDSMNHPYTSNQQFVNDKGKAKIGIDRFNLILSSDNVLTFAINPDYSNVELDEPKINVNTTFALYYPEKRSFFFEGWDIFNSTFPDIFYSRTINDPSVIAKYTGKIKGFNIGYISAQDKHTSWIIPFEEYSIPLESDKKSVVNIFRTRYDMGENYIGFLSTNRDLKDGYNRVLGLDAKFKTTNKQNRLSLAVLRSLTKEIADTTLLEDDINFNGHTSKFDNESLLGNAYYLSFWHNSKYLSTGFSYKDMSPEFRADNGFVSMNNFREIYSSTTLQGRINKKVLRGVFPSFNFDRVWNYDGLIKYSSLNPGISISLPYQTWINSDYNGIFEMFGGYKFERWKLNTGISSSFSKQMGIDISYSRGKDIDYYSYPPQLGYSDNIYSSLFFRPVSNLPFTFTYNYYQLQDVNRDTMIYKGEVWSGNVSYQPIKYLTIRLIFQRDSFNKRRDVSPLISFEPSPFTAIYIGSNNYFNEIPTIRESYHQYYSKLKYTF